MKMLLERISPYFEIVIFPQDMILTKPIEEWPIVDVLMAWYSDGMIAAIRLFLGYPLEKAIAYVDLRKPYSLNDLRMQYISLLRTHNHFLHPQLFFDRCAIHKLLKENVVVAVAFDVRE